MVENLFPRELSSTPESKSGVGTIKKPSKTPKCFQKHSVSSTSEVYIYSSVNLSKVVQEDKDSHLSQW